MGNVQFLTIAIEASIIESTPSLFLHFFTSHAFCNVHRSKKMINIAQKYDMIGLILQNVEMTSFHYTKVFVVYMQNGPLLQLSRLFLYELWTMVFC